MRSVDWIVGLLSQYHQRATYGAIASLTGAVPRSVMADRKRSWLNSWAVNQDTGLPSEYPEPLIHPKIAERDTNLTTGQALAEWLEHPQ